MRRISSFGAAILRRVFPLVWFGVLSIAFVAAIVLRLQGASVPAEAIWVPVVMAAFGLVLHKVFVSHLATDVLDAGDSLVVSFGRKTTSIALRNILRVSANGLVNPPTATLHLIEPCIFGAQISFSPTGSVGPLGGNALVKDLQARVAAAHASNPSIERTN